MTPSTPQARLDRSLDRDLADAIEALTAQLKAGKSLDLKACLDLYPQFADELRGLFPALNLLAGLSRSGSASFPPAFTEATTASAAGELGDFRIRREVGRGGMGVVYEAEQISLGRRVALKILPFAATMDPRHLQRFQNEARAAASLEHPHIVPVYGVGCERAVHFYAMKFIDGQTLADMIAAQRTSEPRTQRKEEPSRARSESASGVSGQPAPRPGPLTPLRCVRGSAMDPLTPLQSVRGSACSRPSRARSESASGVSGQPAQSPDPLPPLRCERGSAMDPLTPLQSVRGSACSRPSRARSESSSGVSEQPAQSPDPLPPLRCERGSEATAPVAALSTQRAPRDDAAYYRQVAEWGIQAAQALEHAHSVGIVHRDIKPANLMIDGQGKLWITDFGLARTAADAGLTMTGDVLGTLRYMSPEQALAKHGLVDHRTDIYSLGVTLYELLTGQPAVAGKDREEILNAITLQEPQPPRALDSAIPRDLETVVLKAMAKTPSERYATAHELAGDLRRFLEARPIQARRPTLLQRTVKWGWRHRTLVWMGVAALTLVALGSATSATLVWHEKETTREALAKEEKQRRRAETNFRQAFWAVEDLLKPFDPGHWLRPPTLDDVKQFQAAECLRLLAILSEDQSEEPAAQLQKGVAYIHTGRVYQVLHDHEKAQKAFRQAIGVFERLVQEFPGPANISELGQAWGILAEDLYKAGNRSEGNACFSHSLSIYREAIRNYPADPDIPWWLARCLCSWLDPELRNYTEAEAMARRAVELAPDRPRSWMILGIALYRTGQSAAAVKALQENLVRTPPWPGGAATRGGPAVEALFFLAMAQWQLGQHEEARASYQSAVSVMETNFNARDVEERTARAEATTLLGIKEEPPAKVKEESFRKE